MSDHLVDVILRRQDVARPVRDLLESSMVIDGDDVMRYLMEGDPDYNLSLRDTPNVAPPFSQFWLEFDTWFQTPGEPRREHVSYGVVVLGYDLWQPYMQAESHRPFRDRPEVRWGLSAIPIDRRGQPIFSITIGVQADGHVACARGEDGEMTPLVDQETSRMFWQNIPASAHVHMDDVLQILNPVWFTISLLHCKNVSLQEITPDSVSQRRALKRHRRPLVKYHVLDIEPMKSVLRHEGQADVLGLKRALHICRGHFKHYENGRGLFGKYHGTYWWPDRVKGHLASGITLKDYRISPSERHPHNQRKE